MSISARTARSFKPAMDSLEARTVLSRLDLDPTAAHSAAAANALQQGDRSVRGLDVPNTHDAQHSASIVAAAHGADGRAQGGGAIGGGVPFVGPLALRVSSGQISGNAVANASSSSSGSASWTSTASDSYTTSSSVSGGVTSRAAFASSGSVAGTSSLTGYTSASGGSSGAAATVAVGGNGGFMSVGQVIPSSTPTPVPTDLAPSTPGQAVPKPYTSAIMPAAAGAAAGTTEQQDIATYNAMGTQLASLRQKADDDWATRNKDVKNRNDALAAFLKAGGTLVSLESLTMKGNEREIEAEVVAKFQGSKENIPALTSAAKAYVASVNQVLKDDRVVAGDNSAIFFQKRKMRLFAVSMEGKWRGHIFDTKPPWRR